jgi:hypothetical protein
MASITTSPKKYIKAQARTKYSTFDLKERTKIEKSKLLSSPTSTKILNFCIPHSQHCSIITWNFAKKFIRCQIISFVLVLLSIAKCTKSSSFLLSLLGQLMYTYLHRHTQYWSFQKLDFMKLLEWIAQMIFLWPCE